MISLGLRPQTPNGLPAIEVHRPADPLGFGQYTSELLVTPIGRLPASCERRGKPELRARRGGPPVAPSLRGEPLRGAKDTHLFPALGTRRFGPICPRFPSRLGVRRLGRIVAKGAVPRAAAASPALAQTATAATIFRRMRPRRGPGCLRTLRALWSFRTIEDRGPMSQDSHCSRSIASKRHINIFGIVFRISMRFAEHDSNGAEMLKVIRDFHEPQAKWFPVASGRERNPMLNCQDGRPLTPS